MISCNILYIFTVYFSWRLPINKLNRLLRGTDLWRASSTNPFNPSDTGIATSFPLLDSLLADNGWPSNGLTEILPGYWGTGEMSLVVPALAWLSQSQGRWIVMISPPFVPYPPALKSMGIDLKKLLLINPGDQKRILWAMEKVLSSRCSSAVLAWPEQTAMNNQQAPLLKASLLKAPLLKAPLLNEKDLRRLQLACKSGNAWGLIFRPEHASRQFSPAELRLRLTSETHSRQVRIHILKRRGGWPTELNLDIDRQMANPLSQPARHQRDSVVQCASKQGNIPIERRI